MPEHSLLSFVFDPVRGRRKRLPGGTTVSDFVVRLADAGHIQPATPAPGPATPPPMQALRPELDGRIALKATRSRQLEVENQRLKRMVGDLVLEKEILQATVRRRISEAALQIAS